MSDLKTSEHEFRFLEQTVPYLGFIFPTIYSFIQQLRDFQDILSLCLHMHSYHLPYLR